MRSHLLPLWLLICFFAVAAPLAGRAAVTPVRSVAGPELLSAPLQVTPDLPALRDQLRAFWRTRQARGDRPTAAMLAVGAAARWIWVDVNAAEGGDGSPERPFRRVQAGIDAAVAGDAVIVRPGAYDGAIAIRMYVDEVVVEDCMR
jgi:hypothetical protein